MSQIIKPNSGGGSSGIQVINGDIGSIAGNNVTIFADNDSNNSGGSVSFVNSGTTSTLNLTDSDNNTYLGQFSGNSAGTAGENTSIGSGALNSVTTSSGNTAIGAGSLASLTGPMGGAGSNVAVGFEAASLLLDGSGNIVIGGGSGSSYISSESGNIILDNTGVTGESNTTRIGTEGGGTGKTKCFLAGITGKTAAGSPVLISSDSQLTDAGFGTLSEVFTSNGDGVSPTWQPLQFSGSPVSFQAYRTTNQTIAGGSTTTTIIFDTAISNLGSSYNPATGIFTAPSTGFYGFSTTVNFSNLTVPVGLSQVILAYTGSVQSLRLEQFGLVPATTGGSLICTASWSMPMTIGDTLQMQPFADGTGNYVIAGASLTSVAFNTASTFSGWKIS